MPKIGNERMAQMHTSIPLRIAERIVGIAIGESRSSSAVIRKIIEDWDDEYKNRGDYNEA